MQLSSKKQTYWNRIIKTPTVDGCLVLGSSNRLKLLPIIQEGYKEYIKIFPSFPKVCPIAPGKYHQVNKTLMVYGFINLPNNPFMEDFNMPNDRYKIEFLLANKNQSSAINLSAIIEVRNRLNSDKL
jgi:hypothetical protein